VNGKGERHSKEKGGGGGGGAKQWKGNAIFRAEKAGVREENRKKGTMGRSEDRGKGKDLDALGTHKFCA